MVLSLHTDLANNTNYILPVLCSCNSIGRIVGMETSFTRENKIKHEIINKIAKKDLKIVSSTLGIIHNEMTLGLDGRLWILPRTTRKCNVRFWILVD